jgi:hypothetical protein
MRLLVLVALAACGRAPEPQIYMLRDLPITEWTLGLPVTGDGWAVVALYPREVTDWTRATGFVELRCDGCTLGDDKAKMHLDAYGDIEFGHITFDSVRARADFADGRMHLVVHWRSRDMTLDADVKGTLAPAAEDVVLDGCVVFAPTDALLRRSPQTHAMVTTTGAPLREDGRYTIRIDGTLGKMRRLAQLCDV